MNLLLLYASMMTLAPGAVVPTQETLPDSLTPGVHSSTFAVVDCTGSTRTIIGAQDDYKQNCTDNPIQWQIDHDLPSGITFTGECVNGKCAWVDAGMHEVSTTITIPKQKIFEYNWIRITFSANIWPDCTSGAQCSLVSVPVCDVTWLAPTFSDCIGNPGDPG